MKEIQQVMTVGELAHRVGLTVRTLHHYETKGLLCPSMRSAAGYRLYKSDDLTRLQHIQLLKNLGFSLIQIKQILEGAEPTINQFITDKIVAVNAQIEQAQQLREQLEQLHAHLDPQALDYRDHFLETLACLQAYDCHFSAEERQALSFYTQLSDARRRWQNLLTELSQLRTQGITPMDQLAHELAVHWMETLEKETSGNPALLAKLSGGTEHGNFLLDYLGVEKEQLEFIQQAFTASKLVIFSRHLDPEIYAYLSPRYAEQMAAWPMLLGRIQQQLDRDGDPGSETGQTIARDWSALFEAYAGPDPRAQAQILRLQQTNTELRRGTWLNETILDYLQRAMASRFSDTTN